MKKLMVVVLAAFSIFAVAGNASAFVADHLGVVFTDLDNQVELGIDLGDLTSMDLSATNVELAAAGTFNLDYEKVGMFARTNVTISTPIGDLVTPHLFYGLTVDVEATANNNLTSAYQGAMTVVSMGDDLDMSNPTSYDYVMNNGADGGYTGYNNSYASFGEAVLTEDGVDMYLYEFFAGNLQPGVENNYVAVISFNGDGSVVLNQAAVPVPGAIILLGTGLIGLVGLRRKQS